MKDKLKNLISALPASVARHVTWAWDFLVPWIGLLLSVPVAGVAYGDMHGEHGSGATIIYFAALFFALWMVDLIRMKAVARVKAEHAQMIVDLISGEDVIISVEHSSTPELAAIRESVLRLHNMVDENSRLRAQAAEQGAHA